MVFAHRRACARVYYSLVFTSFLFPSQTIYRAQEYAVWTSGIQSTRRIALFQVFEDIVCRHAGWQQILSRSAWFPPSATLDIHGGTRCRSSSTLWSGRQSWKDLLVLLQFCNLSIEIGRCGNTVLAAFSSGHRMYVRFDVSIALWIMDGNTLMKQMVLSFQYVDKVPLRVQPLPFHRNLLV